ncbi:nSTAND1 domain-containing NTPase [Streptomyces ipomoeae]|uniref:nSTAND1 domain-containing NTPase n=1 Tax=Streptomyces ipomoeae TaxID=103232 RepID=UPI0011475629|nr:DNA-binding protein [Streptomyces ipomoeae]TQE40531.1 DNA-binding protein [Streptomyces ipomoeae]
MGRQERPLDPTAGPVQRFAHELRKLRAEAGGPTYRELARKSEYSVTTLSQAAAGDQLPSLAVALAYATACGGDPEDWERRWHEASTEVTEQALREPEAPDTESPYQGLARFEPSDHDRYFGRDSLIADLHALTRAHRFTAVFGPSGSGKSSLLRAGLIPALRAESSAESSDGAGPPLAALRILTPGEHPLRTHEKALLPKETPEGPDGDTVILVDQFEEVFTLCRSADERTEFMERLLSARTPGSRLRVVIAVRADFYGRCAEHRGLADALRDANLLVGPMNPAELREAVVRPAQAAGLIVERELTARLVAEVKDEPGGLPLLSHVLRETWRRRKGRALTLAAYEAAGGVRGAIAQTAEQVYTDLTPDQAAVARLILLRLVTPGEGSQDTRRPVDRAELAFAAPSPSASAPFPSASPSTSPDEVGVVLDRLTRARLLTLDDDTVDLAHEALITAWPRLSGWIDEARDRLRTHRHLTEAARSWDDLGRDPGALYRGTRLATATEHLTDDDSLTAVERDFLTASRTARTTDLRRRRTLLTTVAALLVLALVAGVTAWQQTRTSDRRHTEAEARRLAAVADSMRFADPVKAMRLSLAAWELADTTETRSALLASASQREQSFFTVPDAVETTPPTEERMTDDGSTVISVSRDRVRTWDLRTNRLTHTYRGIGDLHGEDDTESGDDHVVVAPDGRTLALLEHDGVRLWDVRTGRLTGRLTHRPIAEGPDIAAFSRSGHTFTVPVQEASSTGVEVWDVDDRRLRMRLTDAAFESLSALEVSPDDRRLAVCTSDRGLEIWDIATKRRLSLPRDEELRPDTCSDSVFAFSPDGRTFALTTDSAVRRWDPRTGDEFEPLQTGATDTLRFSADGEFLATSSGGQIQVWRLSAPYFPVYRYTLVSERPDDLELDLASGSLRYRDRRSPTLRSLRLGPSVTERWRPGAVAEAALAPDGRTLAARPGTPEGARLQLLDPRDGHVVDTPPAGFCYPVTAHGVIDPNAEPGVDETWEPDTGHECLEASAWSANGRYYAYGRLEPVPSSSPDHSADPDVTAVRQRITVWDARAHRTHATLDLPAEEDGLTNIDDIALSADGGTLLVARSLPGNPLEVWDIRRDSQHSQHSQDSQGSPDPQDPKGSRDPQGRESRPRKTRTLTGVASGGLLAVRPDKALVAADSVIAELPEGRVTERALGESGTSALTFSPDGSYFAVGDTAGRVTLWDGDLRQRLGVLSGTYTGTPAEVDEPVSALAFSPDSRVLAVAGEAGTIQLWDTASSRRLGSALPTPGDPVVSLAFSPDGDILYASGGNVRLQRHGLAPARLVEETCARAGGSGLSPADWKTYLPDIPYRRTC